MKPLRLRDFGFARRRGTGAAIACALAGVLLSCRAVPEPRGFVSNPVRDFILRQRMQSAHAEEAQAVELRPAPDNPGAIYEMMARNLTRAAAKYNPELYKQPRSRFEEMLRAMLAQAAYESGCFRSALAVDCYNFWGMKDRADVPAGRVLYKGEYYEKFSSMYAGCCGYMIALKRSHYAEAIRYTSDKKAFLKYIAMSGWCPEKNYAAAAVAAYEADKDKIDRAARIAVEEIMAVSSRE
jgi:hypothetical protein